MVSSTSEKARPGSDIGLNARIERAYLWVMCALSFPRIRNLFIYFKTLRLSTAGISKIMIRLSGIMQPVYEEILNDVKQGAKIWADEAGWHAYTKIACDRQTCLAHIFRKIRVFIDAFPQYRSIMTFYLKLRRIIRDGEKPDGLSELTEYESRLKSVVIAA